MGFVSTQKFEEGVKAALAKALAQIDRAQQQMVEEMRGTSRHLIAQVAQFEDLLGAAAEEIEQLKARVAALEAAMNATTNPSKN